MANDCRGTDPITPCASLAQFARQAHRGVCDTGRYQCPYYVWGDGPNLLFIPGLCDDALSFVGSAALLMLIRTPEAAPQPRERSAAGFWSERSIPAT